MSRRKMVLVGLVAAMLVVIAMGYLMHETAPLPAERPGAGAVSGPMSGEAGSAGKER